MQDFQGTFSDAYYVPMQDFVNGKSLDVPEWNGNVFINAHSGTEAGSEFASMRGDAEELTHSFTLGKNKLSDPIGGAASADEGVSSLTIDAKSFGRDLRAFSEAKNVSVKNVVVGGCQGSAAAQRMSEGFASGGGTTPANREVAFSGLRRGSYAQYGGPLSSRNAEAAGMDHLRFSVKKEGERFYPQIKNRGTDRAKVVGAWQEGKKR